jgi:hypothetical protein
MSPLFSSLVLVGMVSSASIYPNFAGMPIFYLMKVKGKAKIPDYIQLRDEQWTLIGYFRPGRFERLLKVVPNEAQAAQLQGEIDALTEYGKLIKVELAD